MEKEVSSIAKLGVMLIALAVVISLGFSAFVIVKKTSNEGSNSIMQTLQTAKDSKLMDYDERVINGSQLKSLIQISINNIEAGILVEVYDTDKPLTERGYSIKIDNKYYTNWGRIIRPLDTEPIISEINDYVDTHPTLLEMEGINMVLGYFHSNEMGTIRKVSDRYKFKGGSEYIPDNKKYKGKVIIDAAGEYIGIIFNIVD